MPTIERLTVMMPADMAALITRPAWRAGCRGAGREGWLRHMNQVLDRPEATQKLPALQAAGD